MNKQIQGSWFEFQHFSEVEAKYDNEACARFSCEQWEAKIREMAEIGMKYLVLTNVACHEKAFYKSALLPQHPLGCASPVETLFQTADRCELRIFVGAGFFGKAGWSGSGSLLTDPEVVKVRLAAIHELVEKYARHPSFYGWYWPNEAGIEGHFEDLYIRYVNQCSREARKLMPEAKILIAPYGTRLVKPDDRFVSQLESLDVDIIAYQDEVGVKKTQVEESPAIFERLRKVHDRVPKAALWADVEVFTFEEQVYRSALIPAPFDRVKRQLVAVSPYVENILIYKYQGMMNKPGSTAYAGLPESEILYRNYVSWIQDGLSA